MKLFKTKSKEKITSVYVASTWSPELLQENDTRISELCKARDFSTEWYKRWCSEFKEPPRFHRKQWEFAYVTQALWERDCIIENNKGLVFAVGTEPLPAVFAKYGCTILATDINPEEGIEKGWDNANQLCFGVDALNTKQICDSKTFSERVTYRAVDMNEIPADLTEFDFNWSSCSFEHLGTIEKGLAFLKNQLKTLKPGGWAVHTTEFNISSNHETLEEENTVIFRRRDIEKVVAELRSEGHFVEELDFSLGNLEQDFMVDAPPHKNDPHIKLLVNKYVVTSIGLIIRKKS